MLNLLPAAMRTLIPQSAPLFMETSLVNATDHNSFRPKADNEANCDTRPSGAYVLNDFPHFR